MDGESVIDEPSEPSQPITLTKLFRDIFPSYLAMGMSYDEFWNGPMWLAKSYREAYEMRMKNEEWARHRQGAYFLQALCVALQGFSKDKTHKEKYPDEPWPLTKREAEERQAVKDRAGYEKALAERKADIQRRKELEEAKKNG